jgi:hypothetical protein
MEALPLRTLVLTTAGAAVVGLAYTLLRKCGPEGPAPEGWTVDESPRAEMQVTLANGTNRTIQLRRIAWDQRREVAHLLSRAHAYTAPWVRIFETLSVPSTDSFEYLYSLVEQAGAGPAGPADRAPRERRESALAWTFERNLSLFPTNDDLDDQAGTTKALDADDWRLALYTYTRSVVLHEPARESTLHKAAQEGRLPGQSKDETLEAVLSRAGLAHLSSVLMQSGFTSHAVSELAQMALDDRPALLAQLRVAGIERLAERQKLANEVTRSARQLGLMRQIW